MSISIEYRISTLQRNHPVFISYRVNLNAAESLIRMPALLCMPTAVQLFEFQRTFHSGQTGTMHCVFKFRRHM